MDEEARLLERYGRQSPFQVPEGYFEELTGRILLQTTRRPSPTVSLWRRLRKPLAVAAGVCLLAGIGFHLLPQHTDNTLTAQQTPPQTPQKAPQPSSKKVAPMPATQQATILPLSVEATPQETAEAETATAQHVAAAIKHVAYKGKAVHTAQLHPQPSHGEDVDDASNEMLDAAADYMMLDADDLYALMADE